MPIHLETYQGMQNGAHDWFSYYKDCWFKLFLDTRAITSVTLGISNFTILSVIVNLEQGQFHVAYCMRCTPCRWLNCDTFTLIISHEKVWNLSSKVMLSETEYLNVTTYHKGKYKTFQVCIFRWKKYLYMYKEADKWENI